MAKVKITGTGQLNGPVVINKTFEMDSNQAKTFVGANRDKVLIAFLATQYPGVKIDPKKIGVAVY